MTHIINVVAFGGSAAVIWAICKLIYNIYIHPLRDYPGPKTWAATRLTWAIAMQSGTYHHKLDKLHVKYGPIVRVAPDELSYTSPEAWKDIYGNRHIAKNTVWTGQEEEHHPISIVSADESTHLRNRRALTGAFTEHAILEHASIIEGLVQLMLQKFSEAATQGGSQAVLNMTDWLNFLTFDISGALSFGESFKSVENGRAHPWVEISCGFGKGIALMAIINFFRPLNQLMKFAMPQNILKKMKFHRGLAHEKSMQRLAMESKTKAQDYVGSIMAYNEEKGEIKIPHNEIEANMTLLIFAGSETTSTAMTAILNQLLQKPIALKKVVEEIRSTYMSGDEITVANVSRLEYLDAVIQEGIRMGPPAAVGIPRITPRSGSNICGRHVPGGTYVAVNQYPIFRSLTNFTEPGKFVPERFLHGSPFPSDRLDAFEPFSLGRHKCIGQRLAWAIMRLTLAKLLIAFDLSLVEGKGDFGQQKTFIFWEKTPMIVELRHTGS